jgi:hypothetical protein
VPSLEDLLALIEAGNNQPALFVAHYLYGAFDARAAKVSYVSLIRHPVPRIVSCYQWMKNKYIQREKSDKGYPTLEKFIKKKGSRNHFQNIQFAAGFGPNKKAIRAELDERQIYNRAQSALAKRLAWFGVAEYFEETIFSFAHMLGLPEVPAWKRDERNTNRPLVTQLDPKIIALIEEKAEWEIKFYNFGRDLFLERLQSIKFGAKFENYRSACAGEYKDRLLTSGPQAGSPLSDEPAIGI